MFTSSSLARVLVLDATALTVLAAWLLRSKPSGADAAAGLDVMLAISVWIVLLEFTARSLQEFSWSAFVTRKLCHAGEA